MPDTNNRDYIIDVSAMADEQQALARQSTRQAIAVVASVAEKQGNQFLLEGICLTNRFEDEVNRLLRKRSNGAEYSARQSTVQAIAKTIWVRAERGEIRFVVVIDSLSIGPCRLDNPHFLATVLHELGHVLREEAHLRRLGEERFVTPATTREAWLSRWATTVVDEFDVDRFVDSLLGVVATTAEGQPLSLRYIEDSEGVDWVHTLLKGLGSLPENVDSSVRGYQTRQMGVEDLAEALIPEVREVLTVLSHTAAYYMGTERWHGIADDISESEAASRFLRQHLHAILAQLGDRDSSLEDRIRLVSQAIEGVFSNCGLRFETVPEGVYIAVTSPAA